MENEAGAAASVRLPGSSSSRRPNLISTAAKTLILQCNRSRFVLLALELCDSRRVERTADATCAVAQDVGIDHRRGDVPVAQELLHRSDVVSTLEQMSGKGMAEGVASHSLADPRCLRCIGYSSLNDRFMQVMPSLF